MLETSQIPTNVFEKIIPRNMKSRNIKWLRSIRSLKNLGKACILPFVWLLVGSFYGKYYQINNREAPYNYSASSLTYNLSICLPEKPKPNISQIEHPNFSKHMRVRNVKNFRPTFFENDIPRNIKNRNNKKLLLSMKTYRKPAQNSICCIYWFR